jgi:hypothetical protein
MAHPETHNIGDSDVACDTQIVSASKIQMLGLAAIKERLGAKWERMSSLVHRYFEAAIEREMQPGDTFFHAGELTYLVLFRDATIAEAQLKCAAVIDDICRRLFGEEGEAISVRNLVAPIDALELTNAQDRLRLNAVLERDGRETVFGNKTIRQPDAVQPLRVKAGSTLGGVHPVARDKPSFVYRPLWDTSRNVVLTYLCQPLPDTICANAAFSEPCTAIGGEDEQAALDMLVLRECLQRVSDLRRAGLRVLIAMPLHFTTLSRPRFWSRYSAAIDAGAPELLRDIAFMVHGFDAGVPNIRLVQEIPRLTRLSRHVFCLIDDEEGVGARFRNTGTYAIGLALSPGRSERAWIKRMSLLMREARGNALEVFTLGAASRSIAINAIGAGIRYLEGSSVRTAVADPRHAFAHKIEDLYLARQDAGAAFAPRAGAARQ